MRTACPGCQPGDLVAGSTGHRWADCLTWDAVTTPYDLVNFVRGSEVVLPTNRTFFSNSQQGKYNKHMILDAKGLGITLYKI